MTFFDEAAPSGPLRRVVLSLAYDGSGFKGFAAQPGQRTVGGALVAALEKVTGGSVAITCAGRTDTGVHALAQVVHADVAESYLLGRLGAAGEPGEALPGLARNLSGLVGPDCVVWDAAVAPEGFDARHGATWRRYRYEIDTGPHQSPLRRSVAWHVKELLDLAPMRLASDALIGEHDFAGFCRQPPGEGGTKASGPIVRRVLDARWQAGDGTGKARGTGQLQGNDRATGGSTTLVFEIEAKAFCHQMVRSIVGTLVAVGAGRTRPSDLVARLRSGSRKGAPTLAPPGGLCLVEVGYAQELGGARRFPG